MLSRLFYSSVHLERVLLAKEKPQLARPSSELDPQNLSLPASPEYVDELYRQWKEDPSSLPEEWRLFFAGFDLGTGSSMPSSEEAADQSKVTSLIFAYRNVGHLIADVDPLGDGQGQQPDLRPRDPRPQRGAPRSDLRHRSSRRAQTDHPARTHRAICATSTAARSASSTSTSRTARSGAGCRSRWSRCSTSPRCRSDKKRRILEQLIDAEVFESFLNTRYQGQKRFSLEGVEAVIPALHQFMETAAETGVDEVVMGMAHRGRLNVLVNILGKPLDLVFHEFEDNLKTTDYADGDVKYHRGYSSDYTTSSGQTVHLSLTANPSHLEAVDPVVEGRARAKQRRRNDTEQPVARSSRCCSTATPPSPVRAWWPKPSTSPSCRAIGPAARCTSSSTTRSVSPPRPSRPGPRATRPMSPRSSKRRSSTSTATTPRRWSG